jgi:predicted O-linked N-acetylglucosamine transferase (SPINDLY family)
MIRDDRIDVLVDLAGHTANNRLGAFAFKPAPIQATYLGYFGSTGLETMDYWITDDVLHPHDTPELSTEELWRLSRCWACYKPPAEAPEVSPPPNNDERVMFGSFHKLNKVTPETVEAWSAILREAPQTRLMIMDKRLGDDNVRTLLLKRFAAHGIAPERLMLRGALPMQQYLAAYAEVDLALDAFPRTGATTTAQSLWMGVPVLSLAGRSYVARVSATKLAAVGLHDFITDSRDAFVRKALWLVANPGYRAEVRGNLRERMRRSPLCDAKGLARTMESAYCEMWNRYLSGVAR